MMMRMLFIFGVFFLRIRVDALTSSSASLDDTLISSIIPTDQDALTPVFMNTETQLVTKTWVLKANITELSSPSLIDKTTPQSLLGVESSVALSSAHEAGIQHSEHLTMVEETFISSPVNTKTIVLDATPSLTGGIFSSTFISFTKKDIPIPVTPSLLSDMSTSITLSSIVVSKNQTSPRLSTTNKAITELDNASKPTLAPKVVSTTTSLPLVLAKKCCASQQLLIDEECVNTTSAPAFTPAFQVDIVSGDTEFSWETTMLNCSEGFKHKEIALNETKGKLNVNATDSYLSWSESSFKKSTTDYCIHQQASGSYVALICIPDVEQLCNNATCLRKCCGPEEANSHGVCIHSADPLNLTFHTLSGEETSAADDLQLVSLVPNCPYKSTMLFSNIHKFQLLSTGKLYLKDKGKIIDSDYFCVDRYIEAFDNIVVYCFESRSPAQQWKIYLSPVAMILSMIFLTIIVICHLLTRRLRNAQGLCFLAYAIVLLMAYIGFFANLKFAKEMKYPQCIFTGLFSQFSLLSAFFWLSVMCFDIWRVIRATVQCIPLTGILEKDTQKFLLYSGYAFGCPLIISIATLTMQTLPHETTDHHIVPGFGKESCWFADELAQFTYFYSIVALLNATSLLMLGHVLYMLCDAEQGFSCFFRERANSRAFNRKHLSLFRQRLSLFAVMATCWFTEVLSLKIPPKDLWVLTDLLNMLQGVIVFIIFIVSKKKRQLVKAAVISNVNRVSKVFIDHSVIQREESVESQDTSRETDSSGKEMAVFPSDPGRTAANDQAAAGQHRDHREENGPRPRNGEVGIVNEGYEHNEELDAKSP